MERRGNDCWGPCGSRLKADFAALHVLAASANPSRPKQFIVPLPFCKPPVGSSHQSIASSSTGDGAQSQLLTARTAISPTTSDTLVLLSGRSTQPHSPLRSITFTRRSLLVQMRSWHGKIHRTVGNVGKSFMSVNAVLLFLECRGHHVLSFIISEGNHGGSAQGEGDLSETL